MGSSHTTREGDMAEIPIERKKGTNWLPFIIGALLLVAAIAWWRSRDNDDAAIGAVTSDTSAAVAADTTGTRR